MRGERKKFGLRATVRCAKNEIVSSVLLMGDGRQPNIGYFNFDPPFIEFVGKKLPRGVSKETPAHVHIIHIGLKWKVYAQYLNEPLSAVLLWESDIKPVWAKAHKPRIANGNDSKAS